MEVPGAASTQTHLDSKGRLLRSAWPQCQGTGSLHRPSALAHVPLGMWRQGALPFTPFPSQHSLPSPAFSFPLSFLLPFSCLTRHLHVFLFLSKVSCSAPEVSWRAGPCGHLAGGTRKVIQQVIGDLADAGLHPGQHLPLGWIVLGSAARRAGRECQVTRPPLIPWLSLPGFKVSCPRGTLPCPGASRAILLLLPGLSIDAQR